MPMLWGDDQNKDLFEFYRKLIQIRKSESTLVHGKRKTILATRKSLPISAWMEATASYA